MYGTFPTVKSPYLKNLQALSIGVCHTNRFYDHLKLVGHIARAENNVGRQRI